MKNIGDLTIYKGDIGPSKIPLIMWDALPDCQEPCPIYNTCPYDKSRPKCEMRRRYLESIMGSLEKGIPEIDHLGSLKIGLLLAPLFQQLITFKIYEHSLQGNPVEITKKGTNIHNIYKEIRQCIKQITETLKDFQVPAQDRGKGYLDGDSDYYDRMIQKGQVIQS